MRGSVRRLLTTAGLSRAAASVAHFAVVWGSEQMILPALDVAPPVTEWGAKEIAIDTFHVVYATVTGIAYSWLNSDI